MVLNPHDSNGLAAQIVRQEKHAWDLALDIPWNQGADTTKCLLPLDHDCLTFPGASVEQRLVLSQFLGLVINSTIGEMEKVINNLRHTAWAKVLREYPVNPEMWKLGDLFFIEENKHSKAFTQYNEVFCQSSGIEPDALEPLLPKAFGSTFLKVIAANAVAGGYAFWWVVASVEETSLAIYRQLHPHQLSIDPLFFHVHRRHMEEEVRHQNYAFLMLDLVTRRQPSLKSYFHRKTDLLLAQVFSANWIAAELHRIFDVKKVKDRHPFFATLTSCLPLFDSLSVLEIGRRLLLNAPYISLMLNTRNHPLTTETALKQRAISLPFPKPKIFKVYV